MPGSGFASRGKGSHIKRLSVAPPPKISTIDENNQVQTTPTPRTSRSHLLAGLRTAPKSPVFPTSAPPTQVQQRGGLESSKYADVDRFNTRGIPQTATGAGFPVNHQIRNNTAANHNQMYSLPEQVLAPPSIQIMDEREDAQMDPEMYAQLVRTNQYLAAQQMRLQQQLINVTAAAQQFHGLDITQATNQHQQFNQSPISPPMGFYNQQLQNGVEPIIQEIPDRPGVYSVYNPLTGQHGYFVDQNAQYTRISSPPAVPTKQKSPSPPPMTPTFRAQISPPPESSMPANNYRSVSPPKKLPSPPQNVDPLPPPSANAFRPGHRKSLSLAQSVNSVSSAVSDGPKSSLPKSAGFPQTPLTGTFGPGQARAGEHPIRQPRGPPSLEELVAKPTSKCEGSKNFATRQRRRAVHNLVRAGLERRTASRGTGSIDSVGSMTPASEGEINFSISSDNDSDSIGSGSASLSGEPSIGGLPAIASGVIGSERKEMRERSKERDSVDSHVSATSVSSEDGSVIGGKLVEVRVNENKSPEERRKTPLLVLTSAEKRKSSVF